MLGRPEASWCTVDPRWSRLTVVAGLGFHMKTHQGERHCHKMSDIKLLQEHRDVNSPCTISSVVFSVG